MARVRWNVGLPGPFTVGGRVGPRHKAQPAKAAGDSRSAWLYPLVMLLSLLGPKRAWKLVKFIYTTVLPLAVLAVVGLMAWYGVYLANN